MKARTRTLSRPYLTLTVLIALAAALGAAGLRAAAQSVMAQPPAPLRAAQAAPSASSPEQTSSTPPASSPAPAPSDATPAAPSRSARPTAPPAIRDDPTVAPDKGQSADNNVSFPVDI